MVFCKNLKNLFVRISYGSSSMYMYIKKKEEIVKFVPILIICTLSNTCKPCYSAMTTLQF